MMPGSDPELMERQLLGEAGVDIAIFVYHSYGALTHPEADVARVSAINEWLASRWLDENNHHKRYRASIRLTATNAKAALAELDKWGDHPYFIQALVAPLYSPGFGHPSYDEVWRACAERGLPVAVHAMNDAFGSVSYNSAMGAPAYNFELHGTLYPYTYAAQLASLVCGGAFERIPDLKFVFIEGGISWATALGAHLDRNWKHLRSEVPHLSMAPSEYIRRNAFFSTQPVEEPKNPEALLQSYEYLGEESILFSTDYPHWDFDDPRTALPRMSEELKRKIMGGNAIKLYGLPTERPDVPLNA
jgi:predicted TIM-barrel fold metal-dependent hydrolase